MKLVSFERNENLPSGCQLLELLPRGVALEELNILYLDKKKSRIRRYVIHSGIVASNGSKSLEVFENFGDGAKFCFFTKEELLHMEVRAVSYIER